MTSSKVRLKKIIEAVKFARAKFAEEDDWWNDPIVTPEEERQTETRQQVYRQTLSDNKRSIELLEKVISGEEISKEDSEWLASRMSNHYKKIIN